MSRTRRRRKMRIWIAYQRRCDALVEGQPAPIAGGLFPMKMTPGRFKAVGWNTDHPSSALRNGV